MSLAFHAIIKYSSANQLSLNCSYEMEKENAKLLEEEEEEEMSWKIQKPNGFI